MTERKPPGVNFESWVDRQIREARERGEFDNLPGAGKPLPDLDKPRDELWWVKRKLRSENLSVTPPALQLRKDVDDVLEQVSKARSEADVRRMVADVNARIRASNARAASGPSSTLMPLDVADVVRTWRRNRR